MASLDIRGYANAVRRKISKQKNAMKSPGALNVYLEKLSAIIKLLEEEVRKSLIRGTLIPEVFRWIEDAKQVEKQAKQALLSQENSETPRSLSLKISYFVETSPVNDAGMINTREFQRSSMPLLKKEKYSQRTADRKQIPEKLVVKESTPCKPRSEIEEIIISKPGSKKFPQQLVKFWPPPPREWPRMLNHTGLAMSSRKSAKVELQKSDCLREDGEELLPISRNDSNFGGRIATSEPESKERSIASDPKEKHHHSLESSFAARKSAMPQEIKIEEPEMSPTNLKDQGREDSEARGVILSESVQELSDLGTVVERLPTTAQSSRGVGFPLSVTLSVRGELSQHVDLEFESLHGLSSRNRRQHENSEFKSCEFTSDSDDYHILMRQKTRDVGADRSNVVEGNVSSSKLPEHLILRKGGCKLTSPPKEEIWKQSSVMILRDNALTSLPSQPDCPNLVLLFLQRNTCLRKIPDSFFSLMRAATFVDISGSMIRSLPSSLFSLDKLQVLKLRDSKCVARFPKDIGLMKGLEVLDLFGTELDNVPDEIQNLIHLRQLSLTFYGTGDESQNDDPLFFVSPEVISRLQSLEELSIDVHPEDKRWRRNVADVVRDLAKLNSLRYLDLYFPEVKLLEAFTKTSAWENMRCSKFKFVVGQNVKRIVDRLPREVEIKFSEQSRSLRFVNGKKADEAVNVVAEYATALYLDHHLDMRSLSEMGITTSEELEFCAIRECPALEAILHNDIGKPAYPRLEYLGMHYLWKLESIFGFSPVEGSFRCLKSLVIDTCQVLEFILSESMVPCLCNLEDLVVVNCGRVRTIIKKIDEKEVQDIPMFPRLAVLKLQFLPQLHSFWWNLGSDSVYPLPDGSFEALHSAAVRSCPMLDLESLKSIKMDLEIVDEVEYSALLDSPLASAITGGLDAMGVGEESGEIEKKVSVV